MLADVLMEQREMLLSLLRRQKVVERELEVEPVEGKALVITGARRVGKSFYILLKLREREFGYIDFDDPLVGRDVREILKAFYQAYGDVRDVFFDEIQNLPGWEKLVEYMRKRGHRVWVTGSNAKLLGRELSSMLTGRHVEGVLFPFSFREFLASQGGAKGGLWGASLLLNKLKGYLFTGGFPEVVVNNLDSAHYARHLFKDVVTRDVVLRYRVRHSATLFEIATHLLENVSNLTSFHSLRKKFGLGSEHTVKNYLRYLEETYLFLFLEKFSTKAHLRKSSPKKTYVVDNALMRPFVGEGMGQRMENVVAVELFRRKSYHHWDLEPFYLREPWGEVDFLLKKGPHVEELIQVTYASARDEIERRELKALLKASQLTGCRKLTVITWDYEDELVERERKIKFVPLWRWLLGERHGGTPISP